MVKKTGIYLLICTIFLVTLMSSFVFSADISDDLHLNIQTTDSGGDVVTGNFNFVFNITTDSACSDVVYTDSASLTTDSRGIISYYLEDIGLGFDNEYYLCYYRNGVLINNSRIVRTPYAYRALYVNVSGIEVDQNFDLSGFNLTADYIIGDGSYLTNINVSAIDLSGYIPYTGSDKNVVLGGYNFSVDVDNTNFLIDSSTGRVGIGTSSPGSKLTILGGDFSLREDDDGNEAVKILAGNTGGTLNVYNSGNIDTQFIGTGDSYINAQTGNLGIGTTTPQNKLNVVGDINATTGVTIPNDQTYKFGGDDFIKYWWVNQALSIGKSAGSDMPYSTVVGNSAGDGNTGTYQVAMGGLAGGGGNTGDHQSVFGHLAGYENEGDNVSGFGYGATRGNTGDNVLAIGYQAGKDNTVSDQFIVQQTNINAMPLIQGNFASGNVGIGTITPQATLNVVGSVNFTSTDTKTFTEGGALVIEG